MGGSASSVAIGIALITSGTATYGQMPSAPVATAAMPVPGAAAARAPARHHHTRGDPLEGLNRGLFRAMTGFDHAVFGPVALGYKHIVPKFIRSALRNVLSHLTEPIVFGNDLAQLKPKRAGRTLGRFLINTVFGLGGIIDVAKKEGLPHRDNGFGNTLARYGVGPGPYLFLPFLGPTNLRDVLGDGADSTILPIGIGIPFDRTDYQIATGAISALDQRAENDAGYEALIAGAADPYATLRSVYQQQRAVEIDEIRHGTSDGSSSMVDPLIDPDASSASPAAPAADAPPADPAGSSPSLPEPGLSPADDDATSPGPPPQAGPGAIAHPPLCQQ